MIYLYIILISLYANAADTLKWEKTPEQVKWSVELKKDISTNLAVFDKASDITDYCKKYKSLNADNKVFVISSIAVGIATFETSNYNTHEIYHEPPPLGIDSIGLFQLSYEDKFSWCNMDKSKKTLEDPIENIKCAVGEMTKLVDKDGVISSGGKVRASRKGLARYWSTMWIEKTSYASIKKSVSSITVCN